MKYRGQVKNGVVVLDDSRSLRDGTVVEVEPVESEQAGPGSAAAVLRHAGIWADQADEVDRLLDDIREMKWAEARHPLTSDDRL
jgi:hypothetical protein